MSSLKGQLSNVEGSVKSMKMAVVVGSVLTVACLAAVFGVTILANEVSKETKVSGGSLVTRNGETVKTQNKVDVYSFLEAVEAKAVVAGDIMNMSNDQGRVSAVVEAISYFKNGGAVIKVTGATLFFVDADTDLVYVGDVEPEKDMSPVKILTGPFEVSERTLNNALEEFCGSSDLAGWLCDQFADAVSTVLGVSGHLLEWFIYKPLAMMDMIGMFGGDVGGMKMEMM